MAAPKIWGLQSNRVQMQIWNFLEATYLLSEYLFNRPFRNVMFSRSAVKYTVIHAASPAEMYRLFKRAGLHTKPSAFQT